MNAFAGVKLYIFMSTDDDDLFHVDMIKSRCLKKERPTKSKEPEPI